MRSLLLVSTWKSSVSAIFSFVVQFSYVNSGSMTFIAHSQLVTLL